MSKKLNPSDVDLITYDKTTSTMEIKNKKGMLLYKKRVTEETFNKAVSKLLEAKSES